MKILNKKTNKEFLKIKELNHNIKNIIILKKDFSY
jgi:hypothetical protein